MLIILKLIFFLILLKPMSKTIFIKSIEGSVIEFNKCNLCNISEWFDETISNINEDDTSIIDELNPSLNDECLKAFKILCELTHYSTFSQENFDLSKIIKTAIPAIEKWDCGGLLKLWFNDMNSYFKSNKGGNVLMDYKYNIYDIIKYESLVVEDVEWKKETLLFILNEVNGEYKHEKICWHRKPEKKKLNAMSKLKKNTIYKILLYITFEIQLESTKIKEYCEERSHPCIQGISKFL